MLNEQNLIHQINVFQSHGGAAIRPSNAKRLEGYLVRLYRNREERLYVAVGGGGEVEGIRSIRDRSSSSDGVKFMTKHFTSTS